MTFDQIQKLWDAYYYEFGTHRLQSYLILSENLLWQICAEQEFIDKQNLWLSVGGSGNWQSIFERRGLPKTLIIKAENVAEFVKS